MELLKKNRKKFIFFTSVFLALIIVMLGGTKLMIYILLLLTGYFLGSRIEKLLQLYRDYKLSLRVNSIVTSTKQYEEREKEIQQLKNDLQTANHRLAIYSAASANKGTGGMFSGNFNSNGSPWARENE